MKQIPAIIGWFLIFIAFGLYIYGVYFAIFTPLSEGADKVLPEPLGLLTTSLGAVFLTNLGAVLEYPSVSRLQALPKGYFSLNRVQLCQLH